MHEAGHDSSVRQPWARPVASEVLQAANKIYGWCDLPHCPEPMAAGLPAQPAVTAWPTSTQHSEGSHNTALGERCRPPRNCACVARRAPQWVSPLAVRARGTVECKPPKDDEEDSRPFRGPAQGHLAKRGRSCRDDEETITGLLVSTPIQAHAGVAAGSPCER
jgi:hypothetical protein